jgi:hypothetical protein
MNQKNLIVLGAIAVVGYFVWKNRKPKQVVKSEPNKVSKKEPLPIVEQAKPADVQSTSGMYYKKAKSICQKRASTMRMSQGGLKEFMKNCTLEVSRELEKVNTLIK